MSITGFPLLYGIASGIAAAACVLLDRAHRATPWLAGPTVASCLFFLWLAGGATYRAPAMLGLLPTWLALAILAVLHLGAARRESERACSAQRTSVLAEDEPPPASTTPDDCLLV